VLAELASAYGTALTVSPLRTKAMTAAVIGAAGDALAQRADPAVLSYQAGRGQTFAAFGAVYSGAWQHHLFSFLQLHCGRSWLPAAVECTLINQCIVVPLLYVPLFFLLSGLTRGLSARAIVSEVRSKALKLLTTNWRFWLPVQIAIFSCIPPQAVVPATCLAGIAWNVILSSLTYRRATGPTLVQRRRVGARIGGRAPRARSGGVETGAPLLAPRSGGTAARPARLIEAERTAEQLARWRHE